MTVGRSDTELPDVPSASLSGFSVAARQTTGARDVHIYALAGALALRQDEFAFRPSSHARCRTRRSAAVDPTGSLCWARGRGASTAPSRGLARRPDRLGGRGWPRPRSWPIASALAGLAVGTAYGIDQAGFGERLVRGGRVCSAAGELVGGEDVLVRLGTTDPARLELTMQVLEAAARTTYEDRIRALGRVLAQGLQDDVADEARFLIAAIGDVEAPTFRFSRPSTRTPATTASSGHR